MFRLFNDDNWEVRMNQVQSSCVPQRVLKNNELHVCFSTEICRFAMVFINAWSGGGHALDLAAKQYGKSTAFQREELKKLLLLLQIEELLQFLHNLDAKFKFH